MYPPTREQDIAHTRNASGWRQPLRAHLLSVAEQASGFSAAFGAAELGYVAGIWHDLGKYSPDFQRYLREAENDPTNARRGPMHKAAGACLAAQHPRLGLLAAPIAGHHGGLPSVYGGLQELLADHCNAPYVSVAIDRARSDPVIAAKLDAMAVTPPAWLDTPRRLELFIRMVFSALVDADFLDTEQHFNPERAKLRGDAPSLDVLWEQLEADQVARFGQPATSIHRLRDEVFRACIQAAGLSPGFFRLMVPTGGGKTRSGMAFALRHARLHDLDRVIVAIPYTSITEQTADEYRRIFPHPRAVLEHHSAIRSSTTEPETSVGPDWARLAAENWDAPIVVTTTVQLFESLLGHLPSVCRKLHRIARSVIVLDEVQTLPPGLLAPVLDILRELVAHYHVSVVLCTATQPALESRNRFPGIDGVREIVPEPSRLFRALRRVTYDNRADEPWDWERVAQELRSSAQALAIVNTRRDALDLLEAVDDPEALHLSTLLCGAHRREVLAEVRRRLDAGEPCRLVSTQVVEAGVDIDFPLVLRALGPLDRIVQAAGRCNREMRLAMGRVVIFRPAEGGLPQGAYRTATDVAASLLSDPECDLHDPAIYDAFFRRYYDGVDLDHKKIQPLRESFDYPEVASRFRLIEQDTTPVVVRYVPTEGRSAEELLDDFRRHRGSPRRLWREIQPLTVNVFSQRLEEWRRAGLVQEVIPGLELYLGRYDERLGLAQPERDPTDLIF